MHWVLLPFFVAATVYNNYSNCTAKDASLLCQSGSVCAGCCYCVSISYTNMSCWFQHWNSKLFVPLRLSFLSTVYQLLSTAYQLFINFYQLFVSTFYQLFVSVYQLFINFIMFYQLFINCLSAFINFLFYQLFINFINFLLTFYQLIIY